MSYVLAGVTMAAIGLIAISSIFTREPYFIQRLAVAVTSGIITVGAFTYTVRRLRRN